MPFSAPPELDYTVRAFALAICSPLTSRSLYLRAHLVCHDLRRAVRTQSIDDRADSNLTVRPRRVRGPVDDNSGSWIGFDYEENSYLGPGDSGSVPEDASQRLLDLVASGDLRRATALVDRLALEKTRLEADVSVPLLEALCRARRFPTAWKVHTLMLDSQQPLKKRTVRLLMNAAIKAGEPYRALQLFRSMQVGGMEPSPVLWTGLISQLCQQGSSRRSAPSDRWAYELWDEFAASGMPLDVPAYAAGMNACIGVGKIEEARELLERMHSGGLNPDVRSYNILLKGYARNGDTEEMQDLIMEMKARGVEPSPTSYNTMVDAYVRKCDLSQARRVLADARTRGVLPDVFGYSTLLKGFVREGDLPAALALVEEMQLDGVEPNLVTYTTLVDGFVRAGELERAQALLREMTARGIRPSVLTFNTLLRGHGEREPPSLHAEVALLQDMGQAGVKPNVDTFNTLMTARLRAADCVAVARLFRQMLSHGYSPDSISYTTLVAALARLGRTDDALRAFEEMERDERVAVDLPACNALVDVLARAGRMEQAEEALERALYMCESTGVPPPIESFGAVVWAYARQRQLEPALRTVQRFYDLGGTPDATMFDVLVDLAVRTGQYKRAMQVVRAMEKVGARVDKARIKATLEEMIRRQSAVPASQAPRRNDNLERFKFWLGLPNRYYSEE